ncbi:MAG: hypothetical protein QXY22_05695 [Candidatus Nitrosotenuis sp.]
MSSDDWTSPIKEILYARIDSLTESELRAAISKDSKNLIRSVLSDCIPKIANIGRNDSKGIAAFAESFLHYLLTNALIPSQRKITVNGVCVDIVIPDVRVLASNPQKALILFFVRDDDMSAIRTSLEQLKKIQPASENIWLVSKNTHSLPNRTYIVDASRNFSDILEDMRGFVSSGPSSKFRIFKVS